MELPSLTLLFKLVTVPFAMMARTNQGLTVKLLFHWSPLALWLQTNTHHSSAGTSQPHCVHKKNKEG